MLATILFTDIVESTKRAASSGDRRWRELLDNHDRMAERQVRRFGGRRVKSTGDGILATFDGPARAIQCGLAICDGARQLGLEVRVGVHTGEVERRGDDVAGIGVHIAARVEASAQPGEVWVSRTVTDLVTGSGIVFSDRGEHSTQGRARNMAVVQRGRLSDRLGAGVLGRLGVSLWDTQSDVSEGCRPTHLVAHRQEVLAIS